MNVIGIWIALILIVMLLLNGEYTLAISIVIGGLLGTWVAMIR